MFSADKCHPFPMRTLGLELELGLIEERKLKSLIAGKAGKAAGITGKWEVKHDGSIPNYGAETTSPPMEMEALGSDLKIILEMALVGGSNIIWDERAFDNDMNSRREIRRYDCCGLHLHIDAKKPKPLTFSQSAAIIVVYQALFNLTKANFPTLFPKVSSIFDVDVWDEVEQCFRKIKTQGRVEIRDRSHWAQSNNATKRPLIEIYNNAHATDRYRMVNLTSISKHGTIEFRQPMASWNASEIMLWTSYIYDIIMFVEMLPEYYSSDKDMDIALGEEVVGMAKIGFKPWIMRAKGKDQALVKTIATAITNKDEVGNLYKINTPKIEKYRCPEWFAEVAPFSLGLHKQQQVEAFYEELDRPIRVEIITLPEEVKLDESLSVSVSSQPQTTQTPVGSSVIFPASGLTITNTNNTLPLIPNVSGLQEFENALMNVRPIVPFSISREMFYTTNTTNTFWPSNTTIAWEAV